MTNSEVRPPPNIEKLLWDVEHRMAHAKEKNLGKHPLFTHEVQERQGCRVGYMEPGLFAELCGQFKLEPESLELSFVQIHARTVPYVPMTSGLLYMPLGQKQGYHNSRGGIYKGKYHGREPAYHLSYTSSRSHKFLRVYPKDMVFLTPETNAVFSAIVLVSPKMKKDDGFYNMLHFPSSFVSVDQPRATVIIP